MNLRAMYTESERELSKFAVSAPSPAASVFFNSQKIGILGVLMSIV